MVYPDLVARGVIMAVLELGIHDVPERMKFVFHRNAFAAPLSLRRDLGRLDVEQFAEELMKLIERQFAGEKTSDRTIVQRFGPGQVAGLARQEAVPLSRAISTISHAPKRSAPAITTRPAPA